MSYQGCEHHRQFVGMISRQKLSGFGRHVGVLLPNGLVAHMTDKGSEIVSAADFAQGYKISCDAEASIEQHQQILFRAYSTVGQTKSYSLFDLNCEHFASYLMGSKPQSPQVQSLVLVGLLALIFKIVQ
jgi:Lecithin retinol acyltransferase